MQPRIEHKPAPQPTSLWKDRQLRDYRKANGLCFNCCDKFVPGHLEVCPKRNKPQTNALIINDLDRELSDDVLNELVAEDTLHEEFCQLSFNAISSQVHTKGQGQGDAHIGRQWQFTQLHQFSIYGGLQTAYCIHVTKEGEAR